MFEDCNSIASAFEKDKPRSIEFTLRHTYSPFRILSAFWVRSDNLPMSHTSQTYFLKPSKQIYWQSSKQAINFLHLWQLMAVITNYRFFIFSFLASQSRHLHNSTHVGIWNISQLFLSCNPRTAYHSNQNIFVSRMDSLHLNFLSTWKNAEMLACPNFFINNTILSHMLWCTYQKFRVFIGAWSLSMTSPFLTVFQALCGCSGPNGEACQPNYWRFHHHISSNSYSAPVKHKNLVQDSSMHIII